MNGWACFTRPASDFSRDRVLGPEAQPLVVQESPDLFVVDEHRIFFLA